LFGKESTWRLRRVLVDGVEEGSIRALILASIQGTEGEVEDVVDSHHVGEVVAMVVMVAMVIMVDMAMVASMEGIRGQGKEAAGTTTTMVGAGATLARTISRCRLAPTTACRLPCLLPKITHSPKRAVRPLPPDMVRRIQGAKQQHRDTACMARHLCMGMAWLQCKAMEPTCRRR